MKAKTLSMRFLSLLLVFVMCLTLTPEALAASATATSMQLTKKEGTVSIANGSGRSVSVREKMRLYSGYGVDTEASSYAWINLDDTKLVKEDAVSEVSIRKSGKKLEILLDSGNLFFNVTEPLDGDETLNIRTSTMIVGIRGTCGWVKVIDQWNSRVYVLEGSVTVSVTDPVTGQTKTEIISAGETAQCVVYPKDRTGDKCDIIRNRYTEGDIEGFVLVELVPDDGLCDKIYDDSGIDLRDIPEADAKDRLKRDQEDVNKKLDDIEKQIEQQDHNVSIAPVWPDPVPDGTKPPVTTTDHGGDSSYDPTPVPTPTPTIRELMMPLTDDEVQAAVNGADTVNIKKNPDFADNSTTNTLTVDNGLAIPAGKTLNLEDGIMTNVLQGQQLRVNGTMDHKGSIDSAGQITVTSSNTLRVGGNLTSGGTMSVTATGRVVVDGTFTNSGALTPVQGAVIQAKQFNLVNSVTDWTVSGPDSAGYYTLGYTGGGNSGSTDPGENIRVFFAMNDGTGQNYAISRPATGNKFSSLPTPTRDGYTFIGWFTLPDGGTQITTDTEFSGETTVYAHWTVGEHAPGTTYTITFDANGGKPATSTATTKEDGTVTLPAAPTRAGYIFDGWFTSASGGAEVTTSTVFDQNTTIYAQWTEDYETVVAEGEGWQIVGGTLHVTVSGRMEQLAEYDEVEGIYDNWPWRSYYSSIKNVVIDDGATTVGERAFRRFTNLTSVSIPDSVTRINHYAFSNCSKLTSVTIPNKVTSIGDSAFSGTGLTGITIPDGVTYIGSDAFNGCKSLTSITIPDGVRTLSELVFNGCTSLASVYLPASIMTFEYLVFSGCSSLTDIYYAGTEKQWQNITKLDNSIPSFTTIHYNSGGSSTPGGSVTWKIEGTTLRISGSGKMESITDYDTGSSNWPWEEHRASITRVEIADGVTSIYNFAFRDCGNLNHVSIPDSVTSIGQNAFINCTSLTSVSIPDKVTSIGNYAFSKCGITQITLGNGVKNISGSAFSECSNLTQVTLGSSVVSIGNSAFYQCSSLERIDIPNSVTSIGDYAFKECSSLQRTTIGSSMTSISRYAFAQCTSLTSVSIPDKVTSIKEGAFEGCSNLADVYYAGTEAQWSSLNKGSGNDPLTSATIHYNSTGPTTRTMTAAVLSRSSVLAARSIVGNSAPGFTDVPAGAWYADAVNYCRDKGLMNGTSATEFSPDNTLTRAMMVTVLHRLAGKPAASTAASFTDVAAGQWYTEAVAWANSQGIVFGYNETTFGPNDPVTYEQVGLILQRHSGDANVKIYGADSPKTPATRAEIAATLMDYAENNLGPGTLSAYSAMNIMCAPSGIVLDSNGSLLVTDLYHKQVWRVVDRASQNFAGGSTVQDLYGQPVGGYNDAALDGSYFKEPWAIAPFLDGWAVSDTENNVVRLIQGGAVRTLNGATNEQLTVTDLGVAFNHPTGLASDEDGNLYVADTFSGAIRRITPKGGVSTVAKNLSEPMGLCWKDGVLYIAETGKNRVVKLQDGKVSTISETYAFDAPQGVTVGDDGSIYVADTGNGAVCQIKDGKVTVLSDELTSPAGLLVQGNKLYICDSFARKVFVLRLA